MIPNRIVKSLWLLLLGLLIGMEMGCDFIAAPVIFTSIGSSVADVTAAGTLAGKMFHILNTGALAILIVLLLTALIFRRDSMLSSRPMLFLLTACAAMVVVELLWITPEIHRLREELKVLFGTTTNAPKDYPVRIVFDRMHGLSTGRAMIQIVAEISAFIIAARAKFLPVAP